ncbi:MAG: phosphotransferase family protein [Acidimicrobiales bacterium]
MDDDLSAAVTEVVRGLVDRGAVAADPAPAAVRLERLSGGASRQTWFVHLDGSGAPLVLQVARPGALASSLPFRTEATLVRAADAGGVPVAAVLGAEGLDGAGPLDGRPWMLSRFVAGETIARKILRDELFAEARRRLVADCGRALAAIHAVDVGRVPGLRASDPVAESAAILAAIDEPHPVLERALRWLDAHRPDRDVPPAVVHGDFRLGNLIVDGDGLAAVIDWELAHLGDPAEDLGWLCVKAWRFGGPGEVAGLGAAADLLDAYVAAGGVPIDGEVLRWWTVAGTLRWGAICMVQSHTHLSGANRSVELAAIGRRVCEVELDLLEPLGVANARHRARRAAAAAPAEPDDADLHRPPDGTRAARRRGEVAGPVTDGADGRVRYHARVVERVLAMVERELALGPGQRQRHAARLARLGVGDEAALARAIRAGDLDGSARAAELDAALLATTVDRLLVANPSYLQLDEERAR